MFVSVSPLILKPTGYLDQNTIQIRKGRRYLNEAKFLHSVFVAWVMNDFKCLGYEALDKQIGNTNSDRAVYFKVGGGGGDRLRQNFCPFSN